jgi:hypothetical protein
MILLRIVLCPRIVTLGGVTDCALKIRIAAQGKGRAKQTKLGVLSHGAL